MKPLFFLFLPVILNVSMIPARQAYDETDPFLGNYTLGNSAEIVQFNARPDSGFDIACFDFKSDSVVPAPSLLGGRSGTIISTDAVSGNFVMGSAGGFADQIVSGVMESVRDSSVVVKLYIGKLLKNNVLSTDTVTIDSFKTKVSAVKRRMNIRMTSGHFDGDPQKDVVVAYNLPDSAQKISIRIFKLDSTTFFPVEVTSTSDAPLADSLGAQAFFDITAGDFDGDGLDELVLAKNNSLVPVSTYYTVSLNFRAYDFDAKGKRLVPKGVKDVSWPLSAVPVKNADKTLTAVIQLVLTAGDFNGDCKAEGVCGFAVYSPTKTPISPIASYILNEVFHIQPFLLGADLMNFGFNDKNLALVEKMVYDNGLIFEAPAIAATSMSLAAGDIDGNGRDELLSSCISKFYVFKVDDTLHTALAASSNSYAFIGYPSHRRIAVADLDADTASIDSVNSQWYPEIVTSCFSQPPQPDIFGQGIQKGDHHINVFRLTDPVKFTLKLISDRKTAEIPATVMATGNVVLADLDGDGIKLGKPKRIAVSNFIEPSVILNAPPVHFDVQGDSSHDICGSYPIGGSSKFFSKYVKSTSSQVELSTSVHDAWGVSASLSAGGSFCGIGVKSKLTAKYGQDFEKSRRNDSTLTVTISQSTTWDDRIFATVTDYGLWEYPVYLRGVKKGDVLAAIAHPKQAMWFPGNDRNYGNGFILGHEPGNLLSYPNFGDPANNPTVSQLIAKSPWLSIDPTSSTTNTWGLNTQTVEQQKASKTVNYGFASELSVEGWGASFNTEAHYDRGQVNTHTTTITQNIDMHAEFGSVSAAYSSASYSVLPYAYWSDKGVLVFDYMVDLPTAGVGGTFWGKNYSQKPDLAFNCYYRYLTRKGLSLFEMLESWTKEIAISPQTPKPGDTVTVFAEIHNYSLLATQAPVKVRFYIGGSDDGGKTVAAVNGDSVFSTSSPVGARSDQVLRFTWRIPVDLSVSDSIVYAVIDPDNGVDELHEGNNKGWGRITILGLTPVQKVANRVVPFGVLQNVPNPFKATTSINYCIVEKSHVRLIVFDAAGRKMKTLVDNELPAGRYAAKFNGAGLASGIYYCMLQSGSHCRMIRLVLSK